ncbi:alpha/beta hydrolase [Microcoleus sp. FACHB-1515]|uniref:alpha/beta fold hydrolase n=1 Tax=Cyanophyceae TaxID=3028117 RepID=UPI0016883051|nr:alpha/beta hydrolase [Microcoleus sp. FACHB-1515]MBD2091636.1 alpha/beta hydrolase [Microcoleus sp. FACHB-1515]
MTPIRNARLRLSQGQLFWREGGRGQTLVFLHGAWSDGNQWRSWLSDLSSRYHCIVPDLLGFGESERPKLHYSIELEVECLAELLEALRLRQVCLIGDSIGAWIAASYALRFPEQVQAIVLLNPEGVFLENQGWQMARVLHRFPALLKPLRLVAKLLRRADWLNQQPFEQSPVGFKLLLGRRAREIQAEGWRDRLAWLKVPILLLQGEQDSATVRAVNQTIAREAPSVQVETCVGTDSNLCEPEAIAAIDRFLQNLA